MVNPKPSTIIDAQFVGDDQAILLVNEWPQRDRLTSYFNSVRLASGAKNSSQQRFLDIEDWITAFLILPNGDFLLGSADGEFIRGRGDDMEVFPVSDRGISSIRSRSVDDVIFTTMGGEVFGFRDGAVRELGFPYSIALLDSNLDFGNLTYVCGDTGKLCVLQENVWRDLELPTNVQLNGLACFDKSLYICGNSGFLARFVDGTFEIMDGGSSNLQGFCVYRHELFLAAAQDGIKKLDGEGFTVFNADSPCFGLTSSPSFLLAYAGEKARKFDGDWIDVAAI